MSKESSAEGKPSALVMSRDDIEHAARFASWQKSARDLKGWRMSQLARESGYSESQVRLFDAAGNGGFDQWGKYRRPRREYVEAISKATGAEIFEGLRAAQLVLESEEAARLAQVPGVSSPPSEEQLMLKLLAYRGDNPVLRLAARTANTVRDLTDASERERLEREIRDLREELSEANEQLRHAQSEGPIRNFNGEVLDLRIRTWEPAFVARICASSPSQRECIDYMINNRRSMHWLTEVMRKAELWDARALSESPQVAPRSAQAAPGDETPPTVTPVPPIVAPDAVDSRSNVQQRTKRVVLKRRKIALGGISKERRKLPKNRVAGADHHEDVAL